MLLALIASNAGIPQAEDVGRSPIGEDLAPGQAVTVAGIGVGGFSGDGGRAVDARLGQTLQITVDPAGRLFIADQANGRVRAVDDTGRIRTVYDAMASGACKPTFLTCDPSVWSVAADGKGNIYVGDRTLRQVRSDGTVRKLDEIGLVNDIDVDPKGNVYVAGASFSRVWRLDAKGVPRTFAGNGLGVVREGARATTVAIVNPESVAADSKGNVYFVHNRRTVVRVDSEGLLHPIDLPEEFRGARLDVDASDVVHLVAGRTVGRLEPSGTVIPEAGTGSHVDDIAITPSGDFYIATEAQVELVAGRQRPAHTAETTTPILPAADRWADQAPGAVLPVAGSGRIAERLGPTTIPTRGGLRNIAADGKGSQYFTRYDSNRVFRVDPKGRVSTFAGDDGVGSTELAGDGGPAVRARFAKPAGLTFDQAGNLYIADSGNHRIRRVDRNGTIRTVAGRARRRGDRLGPISSGPATSAKLAEPEDLAVGANGDIYIAATGNDQILRLDPRTEQLHAITSRSARIDSPRAIAVDSRGRVFFSDDLRPNTVRELLPDGTSKAVAGPDRKPYAARRNGFGGDGGAADEALLNHVGGLAVDAKGSLYVSDSWNNRVRRISPDGRIGTVAGSGPLGSGGDDGPAANATIGEPGALAIDPTDGSVLVADTWHDRIRRVTPHGDMKLVADARHPLDTGRIPATDVELDSELDLAVDGHGDLHISEVSGSLLGKVDGQGRFTRLRDHQLRPPPASGSLTTGPGGELYLSRYGRIERTALDGQRTRIAGGGALAWRFYEPGSKGPGGKGSPVPATVPELDEAPMVVAPDGSVYRGEGRGGVSRITTTGRISIVWQHESEDVEALTVDDSGRVYIGTSDRVWRLDPAGEAQVVIGDGTPATDTEIQLVHGLAVSKDGSLYVSDVHGIHRIGSDGAFTTVLPAAEPREDPRSSYVPGDLAHDTHGNLYFVDLRSRRVHVLVRPAAMTTGWLSWPIAVGGGALVLAAIAIWSIARYRRRPGPERNESHPKAT